VTGGGATRRIRRRGAGLLLVLGLAGPAAARSPLVAEMEALATRYHEAPARLDALRDGLARAARQDPDADTWIALSRACFLWGDVRAGTAEQKLAAYAEGREAARRAVELAPRAPLAHLLYGINTGRWGQTKGVLRSLFLRPEVREAIRRTIELDPALPQVYALAGNVDYEVPEMLGGSLARAEAHFRRGLGLDPRFTALRVGLAKVLRRQGRAAEARHESRAVLDETVPTNPAEWATRDAPEARALLAALGP
jgi:tetratricopeptide (TPR) repeat protein